MANNNCTWHVLGPTSFQFHELIGLICLDLSISKVLFYQKIVFTESMPAQL